MTIRHFLSLHDLTSTEFERLIQRACELKREFRSGRRYEPFKGRTLGMIFEKSSTRTRVSFESAMAQLGGHAIFMSPRDTQLGRGEPLEDMARVLSKMVDCIMVRTFEHDKLVRFSTYSDVPVINGLTDSYHPCQLLADMQTYYEYKGSIKGRQVAWVGDGNNMCNSYIEAAKLLDFKLRIACPEDYLPEPEMLKDSGAQVSIFQDPAEAVADADLIVTDVWASMGQEQEGKERASAFRPYQVNRKLLSLAHPEALFMHCLPAHRGEEVTADVIDGPQSVVWEEAGNRLHSQKALLEFLLI
ncbi:MAG: ornithine carbamoyltransferase [Gammaproteobacteria bacterium]|nr:MAG: ornithine carbamoyltransferase [Gammaproteobacteria bacterium]